MKASIGTLIAKRIPDGAVFGSDFSDDFAKAGDGPVITAADLRELLMEIVETALADPSRKPWPKPRKTRKGA